MFCVCVYFNIVGECMNLFICIVYIGLCFDSIIAFRYSCDTRDSTL